MKRQFMVMGLCLLSITASAYERGYFEEQDGERRTWVPGQATPLYRRDASAYAKDPVAASLHALFLAATAPTEETLQYGRTWTCGGYRFGAIFPGDQHSFEHEASFLFLPAGGLVVRNTGVSGTSYFAPGQGGLIGGSTIHGQQALTSIRTYGGGHIIAEIETNLFTTFLTCDGTQTLSP